ncbi:MAG TPA: hypothetical protein VFO84_07095, partial [Dehalococcoidia bacterium]|nr:hypothetical protein [Dehalococcoidia bacterium]
MKPVLKPFASAFAALAAVVTIAIVASLSSGAASAGVSTADAALDKAPTNQTVNFGDTIEWSITVTNVGTGDVGPFHLEDTLPANGTGISWDIAPVGWDTCSPDPATTNFTCDRAEALHEGESITLTISGNSGDLESCPEGTQVVLVNNAGVDAGGDDNAANDGDSAVATVNCPAAPAPGDAALDKAPTNQTVNFGDPIEWTITVTNVGTGDVGPFHLEDTLPANGTGISWDLTPVGWDSCTPDPATANFTCDRAEVLHAGESVTVTITGNSGDLAECPEGTAVELVNN